MLKKTFLWLMVLIKLYIVYKSLPGVLRSTHSEIGGAASCTWPTIHLTPASLSWNIPSVRVILRSVPRSLTFLIVPWPRFMSQFYGKQTVKQL